MIPSSQRFRNKAVLCAAVAFLLLAGAVRAESDSQKSGAAPAKPAKGSAPATRAQTAAATAPSTLTVQEALQLTKKSPKDANAYLALGGAYRRAGRYEDAVDAFKRVVAFDQ